MAKMSKKINQHKRMAMGDSCEQGAYARGGMVKPAPAAKKPAPAAKKSAKKSGGCSCAK